MRKNVFASGKNGWTVSTSRNNIRHQLITRHGDPYGFTSLGKAVKEGARYAAQTGILLSNNLFMAKGRKSP